MPGERSTRPWIRWSMSPGAKLISSSTTQAPDRRAFTRRPSWNSNFGAEPFSPSAVAARCSCRIFSQSLVRCVALTPLEACATESPRLRSASSRVLPTASSRPVQRRAMKSPRTFSSSLAFFLLEKVCSKAAAKASTKSDMTCITASTGRKPPMSSVLSLCSLKLYTSTSCPSIWPMCCTTDVLPVPVSPTSSAGSSLRIAEASACSTLA
mmetsp:Transcript_38527/g.69908  ORF Transcript_38527/g.69908 Transcript_38527/m.69908 type:complete len:210 (+) Transcript_38527:346-975(+)